MVSAKHSNYYSGILVPVQEKMVICVCFEHNFGNHDSADISMLA